MMPQPDQERGQEQVEDQLVQERRVERGVPRVAGRAEARRDGQPPGQPGGAAEQFLVEVVADATDRLRTRQMPTRAPSAMPPQIPRPPSHTANTPYQWCGMYFGVVMSKYIRPPTIPAGTAQIATSPTSAGSPPWAFQRRCVIRIAAVMPTTYISP